MDIRKAGARATMQAIESVNKKISLEEFARNPENIELKQALEKWGRMKPR